MIGYNNHVGDKGTMTEYKVYKWAYIEELEDTINYMVKEGWNYQSMTQPPKLGEGLGTVVFCRLALPEPQRIDEGEEDE